MPVAIEPTSPTPPASPQDAMQIPAVGALLAGSPPALSLDIKGMKDTPDGLAIARAMPELFKAGIGAYKSKDGKTGVLFNQTQVHGEAVKQADDAGTLPELAPPFEVVNAKLAEVGPTGHPALNAQPPTGFAAPPSPMAPVPPQLSTGMVPPAPANKALKSARVNALKPGAPTSGPKPGAGRLANSILKPVV